MEGEIKMSDEIIKVLDAIAGKFGIAIDWTTDNLWSMACSVYYYRTNSMEWNK